MKIRAIIFDLDDTLVRTSDIYAEAERAFLNFLESIGIQRGEGKRVFEDREWRNISVLGYSRERLPKSMIETYRQLLLTRGRPTNPSDIEAVAQIANSVFDREPTLMPGTKSVLETLKDRGKILILFSRGDPKVQESKLLKLGLRKLFDAVHIVTHNKSESLLLAILQKHSLKPSEVIVVGDSIKSDINPALRAGILAVHVPFRLPGYDWNQDVEEPIAEEYMKLGSIEKLPELIVEKETCQTTR